MKLLTVLALFAFVLPCTARAQKTDQDSSILGVWKGTSICQVRNSPCHNENVVYYISKVAGDKFNIDATKIVGGKEEDMGIIGCQLDRKNNRLLSSDYNSKWVFNFKGKELSGTLYHEGTLYRIIKLAKQN